MPISKAPKAPHFNVTSPAQYVVHIEINRPNKLNAFYDPMWNELKALLDFFSHDPETRAIVISGAGDRAFTAGLDVQAASNPETSALSSKQQSDPSRRATSLRRHILELQDVISSVARCEKPTIACMHGYAYGLAVDLSSACDIRLCAPDTKFCIKEVDIGLAADVGTLSRLPKVVGLTSWCKEVTLSARPFGAEEALHNNFVSRVVPGSKKDLLEAGVELAKYIASKSPVAVQGTKNILDAAYARSVEDNLNYTAVWNAAMLQSSDTERAMLSGLKKRTPTFEKL